jgi:hypothetical protein
MPCALYPPPPKLRNKPSGSALSVAGRPGQASLRRQSRSGPAGSDITRSRHRRLRSAQLQNNRRGCAAPNTSTPQHPRPQSTVHRRDCARVDLLSEESPHRQYLAAPELQNKRAPRQAQLPSHGTALLVSCNKYRNYKSTPPSPTLPFSHSITLPPSAAGPRAGLPLTPFLIVIVIVIVLVIGSWSPLSPCHRVTLSPPHPLTLSPPHLFTPSSPSGLIISMGSVFPGNQAR